MWPLTSPRKVTAAPVGQARQRTATKRALRGFGGDGAGGLQAVLDALHGGGEILAGPGPARRIDAGIAVQRIDADARIVGQRRQARGDGGGDRLERGVLGEGAPGLLRLGQAERGGGDDGEIGRRDQRLDLAQLAGIVRGDDQRVARLQQSSCRRCSQRMASFCNSTRRAMPSRARVFSASNSSSVKGAPSAVAWISTKPPAPVMTKLASVSASLSSA